MLCVTKRIKAFIEQSGIAFGSDQHQLTVDNTVNNGGIIAHIESNANGEAINKTLNFTTKTIKTTDIQDHATSDQRSLGVNIGINNAKDKGTSKNEQSLGTSSINASHSGHDYQATTQATIGEGAVVTTNPNALASVNRDVNTATVVNKNQDVGGLNANLTVDSRLFTEAGRAQIKAEQAEVGVNIQKVGVIAGQALDAGGQVSSQVLEAVLPDNIAQKIEEKARTNANLLSIPSAANHGGIYSEVPIIIGSKDINGRTIQSRDKEDPYVLAHPELFINANTLEGYSALDGAGRAVLDNRVVSLPDFQLSKENATALVGTNGMMNPPSNAVINILEQTTGVSVNNIRSHDAITVNYQGTHGILGDGLESLVEKLNIGVNQYLLTPVSTVINTVTGSNLNLNVVVDGDGKQAADFFNTLKDIRGDQGVLIGTHSQGNLQTALALQVLGTDFFPTDSEGKSLYNFTTNGSPVNNLLNNSLMANAGGELVVASCGASDFVCKGVGGNAGSSTYISPTIGGSVNINITVSPTTRVPFTSIAIPVFSDLGIPTAGVNIMDAPNFLGVKYPVYILDGVNSDGEKTKMETYFKPSSTSTPIKPVSDHSMYHCLAGDLCGDAFGGAVDESQYPPVKEK